jgi:hypothetical protein
MGAARLSDPEKCALVCSKYPVKSQRQMRTIAETEIPVGLHPELRAGQRYVAGATEATYAEHVLLKETA